MPEKRRVLLTVSGRVPDDLGDEVEAGRRPRSDYIVMKDQFDADLVDEAVALAATGRVGRLIRRLLGIGPLLAWYCFVRRTEYDVIVTDGEQVGIPFALLGKLVRRPMPRHMMIVHILSVPKKARIIRLTRIADSISCYVVYCTWQARFIRDTFGVDEDSILLSTFMVDTEFFAPRAVQTPRRPMICSAGLERRDYPTLIEAVSGLDLDVTIAAASPWSKRADSTEEVAIPDNVVIERLDLFALRELYARSQIVVMPLEDVDFQAGITTILEAMSMARPVICSRTPGQTDTIVDRETGIYVNGGDAAALREAIVELLDDADLREDLGNSAREWAVREADVVAYAKRLALRVRELQGESIA